MKDDSVYKGLWKDDNINGKGVYEWPNGKKYDGFWKNNKFDGFGKYVFKPKGFIGTVEEFYEGTFSMDKRDGYGKL
mgnify:CR=1 FL=1